MVSTTLVARSLRLERFRLIFIICIISILSMQSTLLFAFVNYTIRLIIFASNSALSSLLIFSVLIDSLKSSERTVNIMRDLGAKGSIFFIPLLKKLASAGGLGVLLGLAIGMMLTNLILNFKLGAPLIEVSILAASMMIGVLAGVMAGVYFGWRKWSGDDHS